MTTNQAPNETSAAAGWSISDSELAALVRDFGSGTLPKARWTHTAHLAVASYLLLHMPARDVLVQLRHAIRHINTQHGVANSPTSGYHETLTIFWVGVLSAYLRAECTGLAPAAAVTRAVRRFGDARHLPQSVYSFDLVKSSTARETWIAPDVWEGLD
jgi:hypothetical protein